jgi:hypothetical protein
MQEEFSLAKSFPSIAVDCRGCRLHYYVTCECLTKLNIRQDLIRKIA